MTRQQGKESVRSPNVDSRCNGSALYLVVHAFGHVHGPFAGHVGRSGDPIGSAVSNGHRNRSMSVMACRNEIGPTLSRFLVKKAFHWRFFISSSKNAGVKINGGCFAVGRGVFLSPLECLFDRFQKYATQKRRVQRGREGRKSPSSCYW